MEYRKLLAKELNDYISKKHTQEECAGFIDGFERLCDILQDNKTELPNNCNIPVVSNSVVCHNAKKYLCEGNDNDKYCKGCLDYY